MRRTFLSLMLVVVLVLTACVPQSFDTETWKAEPDERKDMVEDLFDRHELVGLTEAEVIVLLGKPEVRKESPLEYEYFLGYEGLMKMSIRLLVLTFDRNGKVIRYWFRTA